MTSGGWAPRRFWTSAGVAEGEGGFGITLDGRAVRTPAGSPLVLPTRALAEAVSGEWNAQGGMVDPRSMPFTRAANSAIDRVAPSLAEVAAMVAAYGASDLLCYRAEGPAELVAIQAAEWDPLLDWAEESLGARLRVTAGIAPVDQPSAAQAVLAAHVGALSPFRLTALHDLVALTGSLVLGFAAARGARHPDEVWRIARIDEDWQATIWGRDAEAEEAAAARRADFLQAHLFWQLSQ